MNVEELKAIQLYRQHLTAPAELQTAARDTLGVQAQFLGNALHALRLRCAAFDASDVERRLVKGWTVRGTMHVFDPADLPLFLHEGRTRFLRPCDTMESDDRLDAARKRRFADVIVEAVKSGACGREELRGACREAGMTENEEKSAFDPWGGLIRALCENGTLCHRASARKAYALCPPFEPMGKEEAERELLRRYFAGFGPATVSDAAYFLGWTQKAVKAALGALPVETAACGGRDCFYAGGTAQSAGIPDCLFLGGFDQLLMGYEKTKSLYLPHEHLRAVFTRAGIVVPTVLLRGRVVGRWRREKKRISVTLFEKRFAREQKSIERAALSLWQDAEVTFA